MPSRQNRPRLVDPIDRQQRELTDQHILPHLDEIMSELADLRVALDRTVGEEARRRGLAISETLAQTDGKRGGRFMGEALSQAMLLGWSDFRLRLTVYPYGCCLEITYALFEVIRNNPGMFEQSAVDRLRVFREEGGVFKRIWGSIRGVYFQNAMQLGSHYLDLANDTVDLAKPSIDQAPMETSGFKNFETFGDYATVRALYVGDQIYRNNFIPDLLPYCPLVTVNHDKRVIRVDNMWEPISRTILWGNVAAFADIAAPVVRSIIAPSSIAQLGAPFVNFAHAGGLQFRSVEDAEWQVMLGEFTQLTVAERFQELKRVTKIAQLVNIIWSRAKMYDRVVDDLGP